MNEKEIGELNKVLSCIEDVRSSIHRITEPRYAPGTKKSQAWFRKLASIQADIVGELAKAEVLSSIPSRRKKEAGE